MRDALVATVTTVALEERPPPYPADQTFYAVIGGTPEAPALLGLVTPLEASKFSSRIFADLLPKQPAPAISPDLALDAAIGRMAEAGVDAVAVMEKGVLLGVLTRESIIRVTLERERELSEALHGSEGQLRAVLHGLPDVVACLSYEGRCEWVIGGREGAPEAEQHVEQWLPGEPGQRLMEALRRCAADGGLQTVHILTRGAAGPVEYEARVTPLDESRAVCILRDTTETKQLRTRLVVADRMASLGTLAAGVAHEINNPLTYVLACADLLETGLQALSPPRTDLNDLLRTLKEGVLRVASIVRDLRVLTRPDQGVLTPVDVKRVLEGAVAIATPHIRPIATVSTALESVPPIAANEAKLGQVFLNLLVNAGQALDENDSPTNRVCVSLTQSEGMVRVAISDTGEGIPLGVRDHIFEPFFTTKSQREGTGLGLFIAHDTVRSLDGTITVDDAPGGGSVFTVSLPIPVAALAPAPAKTWKAPPAPIRILLVDDEPAILEVLPPLLSPNVVVTAPSADAALRHLPDGFDLILCDVRMPDMSGIELHRLVRAKWPALGSRFVFLTGGVFTPAERTFLNECGNVVIEKPITREQLLDSVYEALAHISGSQPVAKLAE